MNTNVHFAKRCQCGAVTITTDNGDISMPYKEFKRDYEGVKLEKGKWGNCNYCVNHWGTDLCECGSGKKIGKCKCGSTESSVNNSQNWGLAWGF